MDVSAGVILRAGLLLVCQRSDGPNRGLWEFPGGTRKAGETPAACLVRECREELGVTVSADRALATLDFSGQGRDIHFTFFLCSIASGEPQCLEHLDMRWVKPSALHRFSFCPADAQMLDLIVDALQ